MGRVPRSVDDQGDGREGDPIGCLASLRRGYLRGELRLGPVADIYLAPRAMAVQDCGGRRILAFERFSPGERPGARGRAIQYCSVHGTLVELDWYAYPKWPAG